MPSILTVDEARTPRPLRRQVRQAQEAAWPSTDPVAASSLAPQHDPALRPLSMLLVDGEDLLAALDLLFAQVVHAGVTWSAAGLSTVVTPVPRRRRGHARRLVTAARAALPGLGVDVGLFTCDPPLRPFYEKCGWEVLPGTVLVGGTPEDPFPSDGPGLEKVTLGAFVSPAAVAARPAFLGARIPLFCGTGDRLW